MTNLLFFIHEKILCKLGLHKWAYHYDPEYSLNGETMYCEYCEAQR